MEKQQKSRQNIPVSNEAHQLLKVAALVESRTIKEIVDEVLRKELSKYSGMIERIKGET